MSSTTKACLIAALALTAALSVAILGLSARHVAFVQNRHLQHHDLLNVSYRYRDVEAGTWQPRVSQMRYLPTNFTMVDTYLMLAAGIAGAVLAPFNLFVIARRTDDPLPVAITGRKVRHVRWASLRNFAVFQLALIVLLAAATGAAWKFYSTVRPLYIGTSGVLGQDPNSLVTYQAWGDRFSFQSWNCALAPYVTPGQKSISPGLLQGLCTQATAARILLLPALILSVLALALHLWVWRRHNVAVRERGEAAPPYDEVVTRKNADLEGMSERIRRGFAGDGSPVSPVSPVDGSAAPPYAEMPVDQQQRAELPMDAAIKEMMGESGHQELEAGMVAVEKPTDERGRMDEKR